MRASPSEAHHRKRFPANAVVCLWDGENVNVLHGKAEERGEAYNLASCLASRFTICDDGCVGACSGL